MRLVSYYRRCLQDPEGIFPAWYFFHLIVHRDGLVFISFTWDFMSSIAYSGGRCSNTSEPTGSQTSNFILHHIFESLVQVRSSDIRYRLFLFISPSQESNIIHAAVPRDRPGHPAPLSSVTSGESWGTLRARGVSPPATTTTRKAGCVWLCSIRHSGFAKSNVHLAQRGLLPGCPDRRLLLHRWPWLC